MTDPIKEARDLLPCPLKYYWADDEEGPYQGPFDSRDLAISDAYCYRAKCFDDPSQTDGFFMIQTKGLLVDAEESPAYVLSIDVTDEFHDAWNTRAALDQVQKPVDVDNDYHQGIIPGYNCGMSWDGKNIRGDKDSVKAVSDALHEASHVPGLKAEIIRLRDAYKKLINIDELKAEVSHQVCNGPDNECTHCIAICQTIDHLAASGHLQTPVKGWKLVPVEATEEMLTAGGLIVENQDYRPDRALPTLRNAYKAMIEATPPATERKEDE